MRPRLLSERDRATWANYVQHVAKLPGVATPPLPTPPPAPSPALTDASPEPAALAPVSRPKLQKRALAPLEVGTAPGGVDRATWTKFHTGKLSPSRTLDLHGRTAQRAHAALHDFLAAAIGDRVRCVEVITGRGSGDGGGVIRREFPLWLNGASIRPWVLAASHPHAANQGAVRLLLRRMR